MAEIKIVVQGVHGKAIEGKLRIGSTTTLIKSDQNILVDAGYFGDKDELIAALAKENLTPDQIDIVILTHMHLDHVVNTYLFENAKIFCKLRKDYIGQYHIPKEKSVQRSEIIDGTEIAKDVSILLTPGHTEDHISVLVNTDEGNIVIAGDAMADESFADMEVNPPLANNLVDYDESRKKILAVADYIIPGHGDKFQVKK
ncbi:MAG: MBL fold metallo-hydrolase [Patescibacteria group bacterium]|jgi:glyoxylase-like metal-dependent hydrolase (beta-lactamase superfamily II)